MSDEPKKPTPGELGLRALRAVLDRLARGNDDSEGALLVLLVIRAFALERRTAMIIELCPQDTGLLLTVEEPATGLWQARLLAVSMPTVRRVLAEMPELLNAFEPSEHEGALTLHTTASSPPDALTARMTPVALPSLGLLMEAGLLSGPSAMHGERN